MHCVMTCNHYTASLFIFIESERDGEGTLFTGSKIFIFISICSGHMIFHKYLVFRKTVAMNSQQNIEQETNG